MFGSEKGEVLDRTVCPRCNHPGAVIRGSRYDGFSFLMCHVVCNKCHLIRFFGIQQVESLDAKKQIRIFSAMRKRARKQSDIQKLDRKIAALEERMKLSELGL